MRVPAMFVVAVAFVAAMPAQTPPQFRAFLLPGVPWPVTNDTATGDFDGDGDLDLCVIAPYAPLLYRNDGGETLVNVTASLPVALPNHKTACFLDVDGDGRDELFLSWTQQVRLLRWLPGGTWVDVSANLPAMPTVHGAAAIDVDRDGDLDLACAGHAIEYGRNVLLTNDGTGVFTSSEPFPGDAIRITTGDLDGDGDDDLVLTRPNLVLWRNDGGGSFTDVTAASVQMTTGMPTAAVVGDANGDGSLDLVLGGTPTGDVLLANDGTGAFTLVPGALPPVLGSTTVMALADIDGDLDLDLCCGTANTGAPTVAVNDGTGLFTAAPERLPALTSWASWVRTADLDGDGDPELLLSGLGTPVAVLWNLHRHLAVAVPPTLGAFAAFELAGQPGYGTTTRVGLLALGLARLSPPVPIAPYGALGLDPGLPLAWFAAGLLPGSGPETIGIPVPVLPQLVGLVVFAQGLIEESPGLSNARFTATWATTIH